MPGNLHFTRRPARCRRSGYASTEPGSSRPAVLTPLAGQVAALLGTFGAGDEALLDVLFGRAPTTGTLPFELPSSTAAVEASREDVPNDTTDPLFPYGHGLSI
ncbi:hypothetical protein GCM10010112_65580 [Actinoplanes lobatus]|uniref:ABC-type transport system involved in cytochrome bd biosynthesis fused ATPase/permease subunit n=1 Tax=Actinoplanes lobatus TaxID=113568 RepID=A0A7W7MJ30_9ACTN|nr:glycoside hydrolase family 3 C-terminal domain-containing protein [Actinoplanes lobatus]MBB4751966.1 ABC-type transport system involved in cytochrome bd biosynthesis fused ATPase/permease subunit [Actinoplanes lobatus]GGN85295.1 hypothetical protein GCM10010112_65580 [Actinoplanes lobatus]GIE44307.1 hypothetical protein Alo02nite_72050 [Actinoplanes lobatus]